MERSNVCTWPEMKMRAHYLGWLLTAIATAALIGLTVDLAVVALTGGEVGFSLAPLLLLCAIVAPAVYGWRRYGEACCGFLQLESALDRALSPSLPACHDRFDEILELMARIDAARGMERQLVRNEAKAWLQVHASELNREERTYLAEHLGYLHKA
jgi:hypothetical protein